MFLFYHKNPKQATFMGTLIYIFAGWTIYAAMKHPYFSNPMIYLPLVLMGIDKIYKRRSHGCLSGRLRFRLCRISISFI